MSLPTAPHLVFWKNLSPHSTPVVRPTQNSPRVLVVGGGVTGLVTAWVLLDHGYRVTIVSKEWASYGKAQRITSQIAGALWEYPPAVCGQHTDPISLLHSKKWAMVAYHIFDAIAAEPKLASAAGVRMKEADFFFPFAVESDATQLAKMNEIIASGVRGFRHDSKIIQERGINPTAGAKDAYGLLSPIVDTDAAMAWLKDLVQRKGGQCVTRALHGDLLKHEMELRKLYHADAIVNATGLAGTELADDTSCYPIRGALIRVINDGKHFPKLDHALSISAEVSPNEIVFLVPRNDNILIIGGITEPHKDTLDLTLDSPIIKRMRERCDKFLPGLEDAQLDEDYPLAQGLRPFRQHNVRVERELRKPVRTSPNKSSAKCATYGIAAGNTMDTIAMPIFFGMFEMSGAVLDWLPKDKTGYTIDRLDLASY